MHTLRGFVYLVGLALIVLVPQGLWADPPQTLMPQELDALLEKAETAEDHLKLAAHYSGDAERFARDAERHEALATRYRKLAAYRGMAKHCDYLARSLRDAAKASQQLAQSHKEMAEKLQR